MSTARRIAYGLLLAVAVGFVILLVAHRPLLRLAGEFLVESSTPVKADAVVVLAGDMSGSRVLRAAELVRDGFAPVALVSGPMAMYGVNEADLAIQFAVKRGAPAAHFEPVYIQALSTREEARAFAPELRNRGIRSFLLVTSNFHTRRAAETFRKNLGPGIVLRAVAAQDQFFRPEAWWHNREGQKILFYEYTRTFASWLGM